jgi:hypothetical protein
MRMLLLAVLFMFGSSAQAQTYPTRTVRIVVPATPGGAIDLIARSLAEKMTASLGQPVVVENKPGASNNLGTDFVAKSPPDGYTLVIIASSHATNKYPVQADAVRPGQGFRAGGLHARGAAAARGESLGAGEEREASSPRGSRPTRTRRSTPRAARAARCTWRPSST